MKRVLLWLVIINMFVVTLTAAASPTIPEGLLTLPWDAEILDIRENAANGGLEIGFVSDLGLEELHDMYIEALKVGEDLEVTALPGGYMISAMLDGVDYTFILSEDAMDVSPVYAGKTSIYVMLTGLEGRTTSEPAKPQDQGLPWPASDLPGLPELKGYITRTFKADGSVFVELTVENRDVVLAYIEELKEAGFSFDSDPVLSSGHLEFFAFRGDNILGFGYGEDDNFVAMEYSQ